MAFQTLYRKWRPQTFDEVVGQEHVRRTLENALRQGRISHAYLFSGPRGTGKTSMARILAKSVNCLADMEKRPCNECTICRAIAEGHAIDLIEIDAASQSRVDDIRELRERVNFVPNEARYKVYIIDEVHMLSPSAFNAFLKTLEEPPPHAIFILATTDPQKIPPTVLSRCQRFDFHRIAFKDIVARLKRISDMEGLDIEEEALELIARYSTGSLRDAESLLDQLMSYGGERILLTQVQTILGTPSSQAVADLVWNLIDGDLTKGLSLINQAINEGADPRQFNREIVEHLRGLLLIKGGGAERFLPLTDEARAEMASQAKEMSLERIAELVRLFNDASLDFRVAGIQSPLPLELAFAEATTHQVGSSSRQMPNSASQQNSPAELEQIKASWPKVRAEVGDVLIGALLESCEPLAVQGETLVLGFPYPFHKENIETPENKALVEEALRKVLGNSYLIKPILNPAGTGPGELKTKFQEIVEDPLINAAMRMYGAQITDVQGQ